jgi:hypothetical protein
MQNIIFYTYNILLDSIELGGIELDIFRYFWYIG